MAPPAQQPAFPSNQKQYTSAWEKVGNHWTRECAAGEGGVSYNQNVRDGHTELTLNVAFSSSLSTSELTQRVRNAWLVSHATHPDVAIQVSTGTEIPQRMHFDPLRSEADVDAWLKECFHVLPDQAADDVIQMTYNRRLPTKGKRGMMFLVPSGSAYPEHPDWHCLVWNLSHTLADIYSVVQFFNSIFDTVTKVPGGRNLTVSELDYSSLSTKLPVTPMTPYETQYKPSEQQREQAIQGALAQAELYSDKMSKSIAMYPESDAASRAHGTHCIRLQYTEQESQALLSSLQDSKISITFAAAAATLLTIKQTYGKGHETGALLGITRNARRWVPTEQARGGAHHVPNASDVVFLWVPFQEEWFAPSTSAKQTILHIAHAIKSELAPHLTSPHYLASLTFTSNRFTSNLAAQGEPVPTPQAPGFSPQGALPLIREHSSSSARITTHDFMHTGRQINPSAWVQMCSLWGVVSLGMGFDGKYYERQRMEAFLERVKGNLGCVVPDWLKGEAVARL